MGKIEQNKIELGKLLKETKKELKITSSSFEKVGLTRHQVLAVEKGSTKYSFDTLLAYLNHLSLEFSIIHKV